jgi:RNA recognition motif-containing protein
MAKTIYVGNLAFSATEPEVRAMFEEFGTVHEVKMITDRETGRFRGFGFVEMDEDEANKAISELDGKEFDGRNLRVNEARERPGGRR